MIGSGATVTTPATIANDGLTSDSLLCGTFVTIQQTYLNSKKIRIYPNPLSTYANLTFDNLKHDTHTLIIFNSTGQVVQSIDHISKGTVRIERGNLASGLYLFQLRNSAEIIGSGRLILE